MPADVGGCVPDRAQWDGEVRAVVQRQCGHVPRRDALLRRALLPARLRRPPPVRGRAARRWTSWPRGPWRWARCRPRTRPRPPTTTPARMVQWASCGAQTASTTARLRVSRPWMRAPVTGPRGPRVVGAPHGGIPRRAEPPRPLPVLHVHRAAGRRALHPPLRDDRRPREVLHHVVLLRDNNRRAPTEPFECFNMPEGSDYLYAWAPGHDGARVPRGRSAHRAGRALHRCRSTTTTAPAWRTCATTAACGCCTARWRARSTA